MTVVEIESKLESKLKPSTTFKSKLVSPMHHHHHYVGLISVYPHRAVSQRWRITSESLICPLVVVTTTRTDLVNGTPAVPFITVCCTKVEEALESYLTIWRMMMHG
jgi:hypothetical protein